MSLYLDWAEGTGETVKTRVATGVIVALLLVVGVLAVTVGQQLTDEEKREATRRSGTVVNISPDAIIVDASNGERFTGLLATEQGTPRQGDQVTFEVIADPGIIYVTDVR
jgi:hypothetical protein